MEISSNNKSGRKIVTTYRYSGENVTSKTYWNVTPASCVRVFLAIMSMTAKDTK